MTVGWKPSSFCLVFGNRTFYPVPRLNRSTITKQSQTLTTSKSFYRNFLFLHFFFLLFIFWFQLDGSHDGWMPSRVCQSYLLSGTLFYKSLFIKSLSHIVDKMKVTQLDTLVNINTYIDTHTYTHTHIEHIHIEQSKPHMSWNIGKI